MGLGITWSSICFWSGKEHRTIPGRVQLSQSSLFAAVLAVSCLCPCSDSWRCSGLFTRPAWGHHCCPGWGHWVPCGHPHGLAWSQGDRGLYPPTSCLSVGLWGQPHALPAAQRGMSSPSFSMFTLSLAPTSSSPPPGLWVSYYLGSHSADKPSCQINLSKADSSNVLVCSFDLH